jgi:hypothetical protein
MLLLLLWCQVTDRSKFTTLQSQVIKIFIIINFDIVPIIQIQLVKITVHGDKPLEAYTFPIDAILHGNMPHCRFVEL